MGYSARFNLSEQDRRDELNRLANECGSKSAAMRELLDAASAWRDSDIVADDETVPEAMQRVLESDTGIVTCDAESSAVPDVQDVPEDERDVYENLPAEVHNAEWAELGFTHDVPIPMDAVHDVKQSQTERLPALRGHLNYMATVDKKIEYDREELARVMHAMFSASDRSVTNYLKRAGEEGVLYPMPSNDPDVWGRNAKQEWRASVAASAAELNLEPDSISEIPSKKVRNTYGDASTRDLLKPRNFYNWFQGNEKGVHAWPDYMLTAEQYREQVWEFINSVTRELVEMDSSVTRLDENGPRFQSGDYSRAWAELLRRIINSQTFANAFSDEEQETALEAVNYAWVASMNSGDEKTEAQALMVEKLVEMESLLSENRSVDASEVDADMSPQEASGVLDVAVGASEDSVMDAFRRKALEEHPDVSDRDDAEARIKAVKEAKKVLLAACSTSVSDAESSDSAAA